MWTYSPTHKLSAPHPLSDFLMEVSSGRHDWLLTQSPAPLSCLEGEEVGGQASNQSLVFLVTSPHPGAIQGLIQSYRIRTKNAPTTHEMTRALGTLCQELEVKTKHMSLVMSQYHNRLVHTICVTLGHPVPQFPHLQLDSAALNFKWNDACEVLRTTPALQEVYYYCCWYDWLDRGWHSDRGLRC